MSSMLKEGSKHFSGVEEATLRNIDACKQLAATVRTSLGPNGTRRAPRQPPSRRLALGALAIGQARERRARTARPCVCHSLALSALCARSPADDVVDPRACTRTLRLPTAARRR
jgi:hypothetical protein